MPATFSIVSLTEPPLGLGFLPQLQMERPTILRQMQRAPAALARRKLPTFVWSFSFATSLRSGLRLAALPNFLGLEFVLEPLWCFVGMQDRAILTAMSSLARCRAFRDGASTCACSS